MRIPFNKAFVTKKEKTYVLDALDSSMHAGNNKYGKKVIELMKKQCGFSEVFLTPSCTSSMEMGALLANIEPGDEVIIPSYTFSSTANAVVIFGAKPVFCEIDPTTLNIDTTKIEALITDKTKMILPIDYAGASCEMDDIMKIAEKHNLIVMQDCAQSYGGSYQGKPNGTIPHLAAFSFHETKNFNAGEGGGLIVKPEEWHQRGFFMQEKGTDRMQVLAGLKSKYSWVDKGSSYLLSDILAAMLFAQLENKEEITQKRKTITAAYNKLYKPYADDNKLDIYIPQPHIELNHHAFWVTFDTAAHRTEFLSLLKEKDVYAYIGYLPLHSSPMGLKFGYKPSDLPITESIGSRVVRLPFYTELADSGLDYTIEVMKDALNKIYH